MTAKQLHKKFLKQKTAFEKLQFIIANSSAFCIDTSVSNIFILRSQVELDEKDKTIFEIGMGNDSILINLCSHLGIANIKEIE